MAKKLQHDFKCDICGKPATYNTQDWNYKYAIDKDGNFIDVCDWEGSYSHFRCDKHEDED